LAASAEKTGNRENRMGRLEGKSVIITGAGSGIGRAASLLFRKRRRKTDRGRPQRERGRKPKSWSAMPAALLKP